MIPENQTIYFSKDEQELLNLRNKVAELERFIGQQAVEISFWLIIHGGVSLGR
jgi:hypothetical protein